MQIPMIVGVLGAGLGDFYAAGGPGMLVTTLFGVLLLGSGLIIAFKPERRFLPLLMSAGALTGSAGLLGTTMGLIGTLRGAASADSGAMFDRSTIALVGTAESLNNMLLALIFVVLGALLASVGAARLALGAPAPAR